MSGTSTPVGDPDTFLADNPDANRIYDNVQVMLPGGVALPLIQMQLWNTISEFSLRSTFFRALVPWTMPIGVGDVDFNPFDANLIVCWVLSQTGLVRFRVQPPSTLIDLNRDTGPNPPFSTQRTGKALVALKPARFDSNLPPILFDRWFDAMLAGTLSRLYAIPAKPWSSAQAAQEYRRMFAGGVAEARAVAVSLDVNNPQWRFPLFAWGRLKQ